MQTEATGAPLSAEQHPGGTRGAETAPQAATDAHSSTREATETAANPATAKTAREKIAALLWWSVPSSTNEEAKERTEEMLDAYRTEVITKAVGRLRAVPVTCTALTGPVWYGNGWNDAIRTFEEIADYQKPDDEAYPGELQRLRALTVALRVAVLRKEDLAEAQRVLIAHAEHEIAARESGSEAGEVTA